MRNLYENAEGLRAAPGRSDLGSTLPPYVFNIISELKRTATSRGEDIVDLGMGNPDLATPAPIVEKLIEAARDPRNHRYSVSCGIPQLRQAMAMRYQRKWGVDLDPDSEVIVTIGSKEGLSHLVLSLLQPGEKVFVPEPAYPIHSYAPIIAGGQPVRVAVSTPDELLEKLASTFKSDRIRLAILSFPHNPTGACVDLDFFEEVVSLAREHGVLIIHDFAYADLTFDGYAAPSILQVEGAKDVAVESYTLSKSYSMAGWRVGFCVGNSKAIASLTRVKSYMDYGVFQPVQIAAITALNDCDQIADEIAGEYRRRRDVLVESLAEAGWQVEKPRGSMFVWALIPREFRKQGSLEFARTLLERAQTAVAPGIGFGKPGDNHVRFALVENEQRIRQAGLSIRRFLAKDSHDSAP